MADLRRTTTTTALLEALMDTEDQMVWRAFDERFRPIITGLPGRS